MEKNYYLDGMRGEDCAIQVKRALLLIFQVEKAEVSLDPPKVFLTMSKPIKVNELQNQVSKVGNYTIKELE
ncbi:heavy-metal-associated domain-containing protein [Ferruginibacter sp.]|nr:hypothetical protein [Ferruginibacter sp.]